MNRHHHSGRIVALGRALLAFFFLVALWAEESQPANAPAATYLVLTVYLALCVALLAATWNGWWLEARLAAPAHLLDMLVFTILLVTTNGYASPFFLFFVFLLISAGLRWGAAQIALTAAALILLYFGAVVLEAGAGGFALDRQRLIIRSGYMVVLSAILTWVGLHYGSGFRASPSRRLAAPTPGADPLEDALRAACRSSGAGFGILMWKEKGKAAGQACHFDGEQALQQEGAELMLLQGAPRVFLFDLDRQRAVARGHRRRFVIGTPTRWLNAADQRLFNEGLAVRFADDSGSGELFLGGIASTTTDTLDLGSQLAEWVPDHLHRHRLFRAVEDSSEGRARLSIARDLHDGIVQFLAGSTFRVEALVRKARAGNPVDEDLQQLKRLLLEEQKALRDTSEMLRSGRSVALGALARDLTKLAARLSQQWSIDCQLTARVDDRPVGMRLRLDSQRLIQEAVANAVRHGRATRVDISLAIVSDRMDGDALQIALRDDGNGFATAAAHAEDQEDLHPRSLQERIDEAGGELVVTSLTKGTSLVIFLPLRSRQR